MPKIRKIAPLVLCSVLLMGCQMPKNASQTCYEAVIAKYSEDTQGRLGKLESGKWHCVVAETYGLYDKTKTYRIEIDSLSGKWSDVWIAIYAIGDGSVTAELVGHYEPRWF